MKRKRRFFREMKEGESKENYLKHIEWVCRKRKEDGRLVYGSNSNYFSHLVWNLYNPKNPKIKNDNYHIHHKDTDVSNNHISNLEKIKNGEHSKLHRRIGKKSVVSEKCRQKQRLACIGKELSKEHKKKISITLKNKRKGIKNPFYGKHHSNKTKRKISAFHKGNKYLIEYFMIEYQIFEGLKKAGIAFGVTPQAIHYRLKTNKPGYFYMENTNRLRRNNLNV